MAVCCQLGWAKTSVKNVLEEFGAQKDVEKVTLTVGKDGKLDMNVEGQTIDASDLTKGNGLMSTQGLLSHLQGITSVDIYNLEDCSDAVKEKFTKKVKQIDDPDFEAFLTENDEDDYVRILMRIEKKKVRELVIFCAGDDCAIVRIVGKIDQKSLQKLRTDHANE